MNGNQGFSAVRNTAGLKKHYCNLQNLTDERSGYVYIYVSNESPVNVFFDNLQVVHTRSTILEETHYYPFGLVQSGISSKALLGNAENRYKYNGKKEQGNEFSDGNGLDWVDYENRMYDNQLGRFMASDPLSDLMSRQEVYNFGFNNLIRFADPADVLKRRFKQFFGQSPYQRHVQLKMNRAKEMLIAGKEPIDFVAYTLGYSQVSSFGAAFKKAVRVGPAA